MSPSSYFVFLPQAQQLVRSPLLSPPKYFRASAVLSALQRSPTAIWELQWRQ